MNKYIHFLPKETDNIPSPEKFTFPFCYEPHPLCVAAVEQIKDDIRQRFTSLQTSGKMFGVLVVQTPYGRGFLCAFSGILEGSYHHDGFVPPVLDIRQPEGHFAKEERRISDINARIASLDKTKDAEEIEALKTERKQKSLALQTWLFLNYEMLNIKGEKKHLLEIFKRA